MSNYFSREEILQRLEVRVFEEAEQQLLQTISDETSALLTIFKKAKEGIDSGETDKALQSLVETLDHRFALPKEDTPQATTEFPWMQDLLALGTQLENSISLPQEEGRFQPVAEDSPYIRTRKLGKRVARSMQRSGRSVRALFSSEKPSLPVWRQTVPLQNVVLFHLMDIAEEVQQWQHQIFKMQAEVLLEVDAWTLHSSGLIEKEIPDPAVEEDEQESSPKEYEQIPDQNDMEVFFEEVLNQLELVSTSAKENIRQKLDSIEQKTISALSVTDTVEKSASDFSDATISSKEAQIKERFQLKQEKWNEVLRALLQRCHLSLGFIALYNQLKERLEGFSDSLDEFFAQHFEEPANHLLKQLKEALTLFEDQDDRSKKDLQKLSQEHLKSINKHVEENLIQPINTLIEDAVLGTKLERFTSAIPEWTKNQQEQAVLVEKLDLTVSPPSIELETVNWQSLVQRVLNNQIAKEFVPKEVKPEQFLSEVSQEIEEIAQIILTNVEIADEVKRSDDEDPLQVAREGLERARTKLEDVIQKISIKNDDLHSKLTDKKKIAFSKLAMLLEKQDVNELRLTGAQYMAKETAVDWKIKLQVYWAKVSEKTELFARFIWKKLKSYYETVSKFLGFTKKQDLEGDSTDLSAFLSETDEQIARLPFIYRRLFDFHKEVETRFYIRKPEQFDRFKKGYELWQNNFPSSFSIVGEKGSGKSLFIRILKDEIITKHDVIDINFQDTIWKPEEVIAQISKSLKIDDIENLEDLIAAIKRKKKRVVVILENVQNCFVRNINGFEAMEQLLLLISETNKDILWIVTGTRYGWLYLDKVLNVVDYFTHAVETDNLTPQQVEDLILKRHLASGYQLTFLPDEATKNSRNFKKHLDDEEKSQEYLRSRYFEKLAKLAEGNSSVAMIFWIRSIKEHDDTHFYINPFDFGTLNRIQELDSDELFALAAFVLHDFLNPEELSMTVHQSLRESQLTVSRLSSQSILMEAPHGFSINQLIYRQIARALKEANFIH